MRERSAAVRTARSSSRRRCAGRRGAAAGEGGRVAFGGNRNEGPDGGGTQVLRALNIETGKIVWEIPQVGSSNNYAGTLATAGGLVFYAQSRGEFAAVDAKNGGARCGTSRDRSRGRLRP